ncbi:response regulator transcription factor [Methylobacterium sp. WSM2598]|uniref:response regulator transcription factor n=1 Tax=Methylobacterium sp. WSM2598 TaxID=398261 RepID=UPI00036980C1|nr:response regulator transcription factor [Methylobacterium sp. WSM2598]
MYIVIDERQGVAAEYVAGFNEHGVPSRSLDADTLRTWLDARSRDDLDRVEGFLIGDYQHRAADTAILRKLSRAPIIALSETRSLAQTLDLFTAGIDDVVRRPVHVREILARADAIRRRMNRGEPRSAAPQQAERLVVHFDGRDPEIDGESLMLPRRERHILEYLARNRGRWLTKTQIFDAVYGDHASDVEESVVEGHISKLRKKLRQRIGRDPIEAKRMVGYSFVG